MTFTFKRDDEGRETIWDGAECVFEMDPSKPPGYRGRLMRDDQSHVIDAIVKADEVGFWAHDEQVGWSNNEVTVEVST